jgi:hypothetical protein
LVDHLKFAQFAPLLVMIDFSSKRFYNVVVMEEKANHLVGRGASFGVEVIIGQSLFEITTVPSLRPLNINYQNMYLF